MKTLALTAAACLAFTFSAQAGHQVVDKNPKNPVPPEPCFRAGELQLDVFGAYSNYKGDNGWGGGIGLTYFFTNNIGFGVDGQYIDLDTANWTEEAALIVRFPIEGSLCWAPYIKGVGGVTNHDVKAGFGGVGGGVEFRFTPKFGFYMEGTYNWAAADQDFANGRAGFRFVF
jgi:predicted porin